MLKDFQINEHADGAQVIGRDINDRPERSDHTWAVRCHHFLSIRLFCRQDQDLNALLLPVRMKMAGVLSFSVSCQRLLRTYRTRTKVAARGNAQTVVTSHITCEMAAFISAILRHLQSAEPISI